MSAGTKRDIDSLQVSSDEASMEPQGHDSHMVRPEMVLDEWMDG